MYPLVTSHLYKRKITRSKRAMGHLTPDTWMNLKKMAFQERGQTRDPTQFIYIKYPEQRLHRSETQARGHGGWKGKRPGYK